MTASILPPIVLANLGLRLSWARIMTKVLLVGAIVIVFASASANIIQAMGLRLPGATSQGALAGAGAALLIAVVVASALLSVGPRRVLARVLPIHAESILDEAALVAIVLLVGAEIGFQLTTDALAKVAGSVPLDRFDVIFGEAPILVAALLGVGLLTRRSFGASLQRLGLVVPRWWQVVLGLAAAGVFYVVSQLAETLQQVLTPDLAHRLNNATGHFYGGLQDPVGIAVIALSAGIAEEALFRGALQPRLGLVAVALAFTAVHTQYGVSIDVLVVLTLGLGLGLIRRYCNTTTSTITHITYNGLAGVGIAGALVVPSLVIEGGLLIALLLAVPVVRRRVFQS